MARGKRHTPEQIVNVLRQIEVAVANGRTTPAACKEAGLSASEKFRRLPFSKALANEMFGNPVNLSLKSGRSFAQCVL